MSKSDLCTASRVVKSINGKEKINFRKTFLFLIENFSSLSVKARLFSSELVFPLSKLNVFYSTAAFYLI